MKRRPHWDDDCCCRWERDEDGLPMCADDTCHCLVHCLCEDCGGRKPCDCEEDGDE